MDKYSELKQKNQDIEKYSQKHLTETSHKRLCECWDWANAISDKEMEKLRVTEAPSCKKRVCAICSTNKAMKNAVMISVFMDWIADVHEKEFIFLTHSAPNVTGGELPFEFTRFNEGLARLRKCKEVQAMNRGIIRKLEVTYNDEETITRDMWEGKARYKKPMADYFRRLGLKIGDPNPNYDTYNLHVHSIVAVDKHYFTSRQYISQEKWLKLWRRSMRDPTIMKFHVQKIKKTEERKEVHEIAKYAVKIDELANSQEVFDVLYISTYRRQLLTFNGLFKEGVSKYKEYLKHKKTHKPHEFDKYITPDTTEYFYKLYYKWGGNKYNEDDKRELTPEEQAHIARIAFTDDFELED